MKNATGHEGTDRNRAQQAILRLVLHACLQVAAFCAANGQQTSQLPFVVTWIDWSDFAREQQRSAYRAEAREHEVLFCVESWYIEPAKSGYRRLVITRTRRLESGEKHRVPDVGPKCRDKEGRALPTIHTHSDGSCQMSPPDLVAIARRGAPFDGVQCGDNYFVWAFAWQVKAMTTWVALATSTTASSSPSNP